eukprot:2165233-Rhodomonas_salina.1
MLWDVGEVGRHGGWSVDRTLSQRSESDSVDVWFDRAQGSSSPRSESDNHDVWSGRAQGVLLRPGQAPQGHSDRSLATSQPPSESTLTLLAAVHGADAAICGGDADIYGGDADIVVPDTGGQGALRQRWFLVFYFAVYPSTPSAHAVPPLDIVVIIRFSAFGATTHAVAPYSSTLLVDPRTHPVITTITWQVLLPASLDLPRLMLTWYVLPPDSTSTATAGWTMMIWLRASGSSSRYCPITYAG